MNPGLAVDVRGTAGDLRLEVELEVPAPATVAILGPNGAGKTTLLRMLAGLHPVDAGHVRLDGDTLDDTTAGVHVPTEHRSVGVVFQDHLLFPHLSVVDNVAFGLRCRGTARAAARAEAAAWTARVGLAGREHDRPGSLSGGEAQRVALARALAVRPRLLLLDEPMAALDATTRATTRRDLLDVLAGHEGVRIIVTHDPLEAMALADDLVVLEAGRVVQRGSAAALAAEPESTYVADLVGVNRLTGRIDAPGSVILEGRPDVTLSVPSDAAPGDVAVVFHPRAVSLHRVPPEGSARNVWAGEAMGIERMHDRARVRIAVGGGAAAPLPLVVVAEVTSGAVGDLELERGGAVWLSIKATELVVFAR